MVWDSGYGVVWEVSLGGDLGGRSVGDLRRWFKMWLGRVAREVTWESGSRGGLGGGLVCG